MVPEFIGLVRRLRGMTRQHHACAGFQRQPVDKLPKSPLMRRQ